MMSQDMLEQLRAIDSAVLTEIVRQDQRSAAFEIGDWTVDRLSRRGIANPDGLFRFSGDGRAGQATRPWSVVLKVVQKPDEAQDPQDIWYWKRELLVAQSHLLEGLPGPVVAPRLYGTIEHADHGWIWMEHIRATPDGPWTRAQYAFAAHQLGRFNGAYLTGASLPDYPWLARDHCRWWLATATRLNPDKAWDNRFVKEAFSEAIRPRVEQLWREKERFLAALNQVPQLFSHFDFQRRNLIIRSCDDGTDEVVAVDWAWAGIGPVGGDLYMLIGDSALLFEVELGDLPELETIAMDAHLAGLRDAGWTGDPQLVRFVYAAWFALQVGAAAPTMVAAWTGDETDTAVFQQFGRGPEAFASGLAALCEVALDRADEARELIAHLRLG